MICWVVAYKMGKGAVTQPDVINAGSSRERDNDALRRELAEDEELQGLTLYEKKAALVNRELDSHGMGRYQWWIWAMCGFG